MVDYRKIEEECFNYLKGLNFDNVIWLSDGTSNPIDFKCIKEGKEYLIDGKYINDRFVTLLPSQHNVDGIVIHDGVNIKLIWKQDFNNYIKKRTTDLIRINTDIKLQLDRLKIHHKQSYSEVIEKLLLNQLQKVNNC